MMFKSCYKNLMVTVSGGRSSAMMAYHLHISEKYKDYNKLYVFANTGQERQETIDFLKNIVKYWGISLNLIEAVGSAEMGVGITYKIVDFDTLSMNSEPFESVINHKTKGVFKGLPNQDAPYCQENLKTIPCKKFCDDIFGVNNYKIAIGFRKEDMPRRISWAEIKHEEKKIFPLLTDFDYPIGQKDLNIFWDKQPFKLEIHGKFGNCELCYKKSDNVLIENIRKGCRSIEWWKRMEKEQGNTSFRDHKSINDLIKLANLPHTQELNFDEDINKDGCVCSF